jgi:hypothetical protein
MKHYVFFTLFILVALCLAACGGVAPTPTPLPECTPVPGRENAAQEAIDAGAVVVYERFSEYTCLHEVWSIYPDGRIVGDDGHTQTEATVTAEEVSTLLAEIDELGFFELLSTEHTPCRKCFFYLITVSHGDEVKSVSAVDGGTDTPGEYWKVFAKIKRLLPESAE